MTTVAPHRDVLSVFGNIVFGISLVVAAIIIARIGLVQADAGTDGGIAEFVRHLGYVLTTPFHGLVDLDDADSQELVNDSIAAGVYLALGYLTRRVLH